MISKRISAIGESITLAVSAKAKQMKVEGHDVVGFGAGEPDFDTPSYIKEAAKKAIDEGFTKYTPASGTKELKAAVINKFKTDNNLTYEENQILISCGAKHSLFNAIVALCQEGDEVILPSPYWVSYPEMIKASGAKPVIIETGEDEGFKVTPQQLSGAITSRTKIFVLNTPSNPTGAAYTVDELREIAAILIKHDVYCISDEIYEKIVYDNTRHVSIASLGDEIYKRTIVINGVSKVYSMTGWRIGYAAADPGVIKAMSNFQSHSTSNPSSISQKAALAALSGDQSAIGTMVSEFDRRRSRCLELTEEIPGISCFKPEGAFYLFCGIKGLIGKKYEQSVIDGSLVFSKLLLEKALVAVVPGIAFGADNYIRISYATSMNNIEKGLARIKQFVSQLQ